MGFVVHTSAFTAHRSAIPGKLWFPRNWETNMPENAHFRIENMLHYSMCILLCYGPVA